MKRYRLMLVIAVLTLFVSTLFLRLSEAQKRQVSTQAKRSERLAADQDNRRPGSGVPIVVQAANFAESVPMRDLPEVKVARKGFKFAVRNLEKEREEKREHPQITQIPQIETERNLRQSAKSVDESFSPVVVMRSGWACLPAWLPGAPPPDPRHFALMSLRAKRGNLLLSQ